MRPKPRRRLLIVTVLALAGSGSLVWAYRHGLRERWHIHRLASSEWDDAIAAAEWLGRSGSARAVPSLFERLVECVELRRSASGVSSGDDHAGSHELAVACTEGLARRSDVVPWLTEKLDSARDAARIAACRALAEAADSGSPAAVAVPRLTGVVLADSTRDAREAALSALGAMGTSAHDALPALRAILRDPASWHLPPGPTPDLDELVRSRVRDVIERIEGDFD